MDVRNISNHGNIDRNGNRSQRVESKRQDAAAPVARADDARISSAGRDAAAAVERLVERAREDASDREELIEAARAKLVSGELDGEAALGATAEALLDRGFLSA